MYTRNDKHGKRGKRGEVRCLLVRIMRNGNIENALFDSTFAFSITATYNTDVQALPRSLTHVKHTLGLFKIPNHEEIYAMDDIQCQHDQHPSTMLQDKMKGGYQVLRPYRHLCHPLRSCGGLIALAQSMEPGPVGGIGSCRCSACDPGAGSGGPLMSLPLITLSRKWASLSRISRSRISRSLI